MYASCKTVATIEDAATVRLKKKEGVTQRLTALTALRWAGSLDFAMAIEARETCKPQLQRALASLCLATRWMHRMQLAAGVLFAAHLLLLVTGSVVLAWWSRVVEGGERRQGARSTTD